MESREDEEDEAVSNALTRSLSHLVPTGDGVARIERLRAAAIAFGQAVEAETKPSREASLAKTHLEDSLMWAVKSVVIETAVQK